MLVKHTSHSERGQVYIPQINWLLMVACVALVLGFQSSGAMAAAYGIAVTLTMLLTTILFVTMARKVWKWPIGFCLLFAGFFGLIECGFFAANLFKIFHGGWFALLAAGLIFLLMTTWKAGREALYKSIQPALLPMNQFLEDVQRSQPARVKGSAIFLSSTADATPLALLHNLRHNQVLHETVIIVSVCTELRAFLDPQEEPITVKDLGHGFFQVIARFGYMETPNVPLVISLLPDFGVPLDAQQMTYFLSRERIVPSKTPQLNRLRRVVFSFLARNATSPADFFCLPPGRVVEFGVQVEC
jgi:KUP system potassium uptake protein